MAAVAMDVLLEEEIELPRLGHRRRPSIAAGRQKATPPPPPRQQQAELGRVGVGEAVASPPPLVPPPLAASLDTAAAAPGKHVSAALRGVDGSAAHKGREQAMAVWPPAGADGELAAAVSRAAEEWRVWQPPVAARPAEHPANVCGPRVVLGDGCINCFCAPSPSKEEIDVLARAPTTWWPATTPPGRFCDKNRADANPCCSWCVDTPGGTGNFGMCTNSRSLLSVSLATIATDTPPRAPGSRTGVRRRL